MPNGKPYFQLKRSWKEVLSQPETKRWFLRLSITSAAALAAAQVIIYFGT